MCTTTNGLTHTVTYDRRLVVATMLVLLAAAHSCSRREPAVEVVFVGDIMLDRYIHGDVERISPEAPVPVLRHVQRYERAGGAANVAMNLAGLGCQTFLSGFWGEDGEQHELAGLLGKAGIDTTGVVTGSLPTISKTRIVGRNQQLLRLDKVSNTHS